MKSFGLWYKSREERGQEEPVFSIHVNFWSESIKKGNSSPDLDIGIKIVDFKNIEEVVFHCPFDVEENGIIDLSEKLYNKKNANIIFNTDGEVETKGVYSLYKFAQTDTEELLLIFPLKQDVGKICTFVRNDGKTDIIFRLTEFEQFLKGKSDFDGINSIYIRFRISTNALKNSICFDSEPLNKSFDSAFSGTRIVDFKINEKRNLGDKTITQMELKDYSWPKVDKIHLLIMEPASYDVESFADEKVTCRELEGKLWDDYFGSEIDLSKGHILAYHWRFKEKSECSCLIKVKYSRAKWSTIFAYIFIVIALGVLGSTLVSATQAFFMSESLVFAGIDIVGAAILLGIGLLLGNKK